jgi:hypothetical protein
MDNGLPKILPWDAELIFFVPPDIGLDVIGLLGSRVLGGLGLRID